MYLRLTLFFCLLFSSSRIVADDVVPFNGPDYAPPFEVKTGERVEGDLRVESFLDSGRGNEPAVAASWVFGNKRVAIQERKLHEKRTGNENVVTLYINEDPVMHLILVGSYRNASSENINMMGPDLGDTVSIEADVNGIRVSNRYPLPNGTETEFVYQLKSLGESRVKLSWDIGCNPEQVHALNDESGVQFGDFLIYFDIEGNYRKNGLQIDGVSISPKPVDELKASEGKRIPLWSGTLHHMHYAPSDPLFGLVVESETGLKGSLREIYHYNRIDLGFKFSIDQPQGSMVIDLGKVAPPNEDAPPPVEGHDLWAQDALHIPKSPTRNLFPNPSFEQGMRYWRWWFGGASYERSDVLRYGIDPQGGLFGSKAMVIHPVQQGSQPLRSFSLPGLKGKVYTVSFYARAEDAGATIKLAPYSSKDGGQFTRQTVYKETESYELNNEWQRFAYSFVSDGTPTSFILSVNGRRGKVWLDGIQYEAGDRPTEFVAAPLDGVLITSHAQNNIESGYPIDARFEISGEPGTHGTVTLTLEDFFNEEIWSQTFDVHGGEALELPFDELGLDRGSFILKARYEVPGVEAYYDYYRFGVIQSKPSDFPTKDLYGALITTRINREEERIELMQRMGFTGSTSYGPGKIREPLLYEVREKYDLTDYTHSISNFPHLTKQDLRDMHPDIELMRRINLRVWKRYKQRGDDVEMWEEYSDEAVAAVEEMSERAARTCPDIRVWSFGTEEEIAIPSIYKNRDFEEYAKLLRAFYRGIKKGNPDAIVLPSGGTSGYGKTRGKKDIEGFLSTTPDVRWDAIAVHPYGAIDGTLGAGDLDESMQMLRDSMAEFGYGLETPIYLNEGGGGSGNLWGDGPDYSYSGGQPSYDVGLHEFLHAAKMVRQYIICLKYWPQLEHFNTWQNDTRTIVDYDLTPNSFLFGISTLTDLLPEPTFVGDVRPAQGVRGYVFDDAVNGYVAAVWCTVDDVERGFMRGPVMRVKFEGTLPKLVDMMGRSSELEVAEDGWSYIQLTPAPLYLVGGEVDDMSEALQNADVIGAGANVSIAFNPSLTGSVIAELENLTSRQQVGHIQYSGGELKFDLPAKQKMTAELAGVDAPAPGEIYDWNFKYELKQPGQEAVAQEWDMDYLYAPKVEGGPDWSQIPAIQMTNLYRPERSQKRTPGGHPGDISAQFQVAWDEDNFYLRVEAEDDIFKVDDERFWSSSVAQEGHLYQLDGCLEVYFDCAANGRVNNAGFDLDDYRYDFSVNNPEGESGPALVCRFREVYLEYAGGIDFPSKEEAAEGIQAEFTRISDTRYAYTITFAHKYILPMKLEAGELVGFGLYLHDRMDDGTYGAKGLSLATKEGAHVDANPQLWPIMVLAD